MTKNGAMRLRSLINYVKNLVILDTSVETCIRRNAGRKHRLPDYIISQSAQKIDSPTSNEGWDNIYLWGKNDETN